MNDSYSETRQNHLQFFGKVTASVSHEINNVFAIINEMAGLLDDLIEGTKQGRSLDAQKIANISERTQSHIQRGKQIVRRLNRFAHSVDENITQFDLVETLSDLINIANRFASLKGIQLSPELPDIPITIENNRYLMMMTIFSSLEKFFHELDKGETVVVTIEQQEQNVHIIIQTGELNKSVSMDTISSNTENLIKKVGGDIHSQQLEENRVSITLLFPYTIESLSL